MALYGLCLAQDSGSQPCKPKQARATNSLATYGGMRSVVANYRRTRLSSNNMATVEQSIIALNLQLSEANTQIGMMSLALDTLRNESIAASGSRLAAPVCRGASCWEKDKRSSLHQFKSLRRKQIHRKQERVLQDVVEEGQDLLE